jgi:hypothetical protein
MIVEEQSIDDPFLLAPTAEIRPNHRGPNLTHTLSNYLQANAKLNNCVTHEQLHKDLKAYNWLWHGKYCK